MIYRAIAKGAAPNLKFDVIAYKKLPKPKTTAEWLAYIAIDMYCRGANLRAIGKYIDGIPERIAANKKNKVKK